MPMERATLAEAWKTYREMAVSPTAGPTQVHETKKAFYAGAAVCLMVLQRIGDDDISEDLGVAIIERLHQESRAFVEAVSALAGEAGKTRES